MAVVGVREVVAERRAAEATRADDELARRQEMDRTATRDDRIARDGVVDDQMTDGRTADGRYEDGRVTDGRYEDGRYEPDRPYSSQSNPDQPTTRYDSGMVGSDYGSSEYDSRSGSTARYPAHEAPEDDRR
jgi:hypothetical protein